MSLLLTAALFWTGGFFLATRSEDLPFQRACYAGIGGVGAWLASTWILALTGALTRPFLVGRLIALIVLCAVLGWKHRTVVRSLFEVRIPPVLIVAFGFIAVWSAYILWRGAILPPVSHDALSYHLPKATFIALSGRYQYLPELIPAVRTLPVNYELLLAEVIVWSGSDALTEWVSLLFYLLFVVAAAALAEIWVGRSRPAIAVVALCTAGIPVVLLHSGAHKNDLMVTALMAAGLVAAFRWIDSGDFRTLVLLLIAFAAAVGTKPQAGLLALALAPAVAWRLVTEMRRGMLWRRVAGVTVIAVASFVLLGGAVYISNIVHEHALLNAKEYDRSTVEIVPYGDWRNLYQGPYVLLAAPFAPSAEQLSVPWEQRPWFWRAYEIYFSDLGVVFSIAVLTLPFAALFGWGRGKSAAALWIGGAVLVTFLVMLPVGFKPHGLYTISLPRYALFIVPVVFAWTLAPAVERLRSADARLAVAAVVIAAAVFTVYAVRAAVHDRFAPLDYVLWARSHPGTRVVPFDPNRAASVADRVAGPRDVIAIDAGFGTWIQPAFGADLKRPVKFIPAGDGPPRIPPGARVVAVDRAYSAVWGNPNFRDLSQARQYLLRGTPTPQEVRTINYLSSDPDYKLVFYNRYTVQAVFVRVR